MSTFIDDIRQVVRSGPHAHTVSDIAQTLKGHGLTVGYCDDTHVRANWSAGSYSSNRDVAYSWLPEFVAEPNTVEVAVWRGTEWLTAWYFAHHVNTGLVAAYVTISELCCGLAQIAADVAGRQFDYRRA